MLMPISCVECRRRKVKCNKQVPCNQCLVRNRQCSYPEKFRSIRVDQFIIDAPEDEKADSLSSGLVSPTSGTVKSEPPAIPAKRGPEDDPAIVGDAGNDKDEIIQNLRKDNEALKLKIKELKLKYKRDKLKEYDEDNAAEDSGNSKPAGPMYYGPNSTRFMISRALSNADVGEFDDFINVKRQMKQKRQLPILYQELEIRHSGGNYHQSACLHSGV
ncbi:uncharacterized protein OGAPODRAFT_22613 [Ogataea polymorpha]|uniref:uncharacterized protein n=1 Tax=Ogataea polymorpha TaxID=460523 RepID=UPI0007F3838B|nr:uncharacterized protein OGAPODRAFT_22613 [Ogataea polymorpha]OBA18303.1 hypothetical protein OGAPODRAFT_22613 [Ogataea polymorpha]